MTAVCPVVAVYLMANWVSAKCSVDFVWCADEMLRVRFHFCIVPQSDNVLFDRLNESFPDVDLLDL